MLGYPESLATLRQKGVATGNPLYSRPEFSPLEIPGLLAWYDLSDRSTLFQDSSFTPAVADGDPVGMVLDKGPHQYHVYQSDGLTKGVLDMTTLPGRQCLKANGTSTSSLISQKYLLQRVSEPWGFVVFTTSLVSRYPFFSGTTFVQALGFRSGSNLSVIYPVWGTFEGDQNGVSLSTGRGASSTPGIHGFKLSPFHQGAHKAYWGASQIYSSATMIRIARTKSYKVLSSPLALLSLLATVDGSSGINGCVFEVIFGEGPLSDPASATIQNYLLAKYGPLTGI